MEEQDKKKLEAAKLRMEKLAEELEKHNKAYYIDNAPTVSDEVYDSLFQELARLEKEYPQFKSAVSPTERVGATVQSELKKVMHAVPMLSIHTETDYTAQGAYDFDARVRRELELTSDQTVDYDCELKFDGSPLICGTKTAFSFKQLLAETATRVKTLLQMSRRLRHFL